MTPSIDPEVDPRLLFALGDPLRHRVLTAVAETPSSASTIASQLKLPAAEIRRHLSDLLECDAIEPLDGDGIEGDERRYRSMVRPFLDDAHWRLVPASHRHAIFALTLRRVFERVGEAIATDGFGHVQTHVSLTRLLLDEQGWQQLSDLLAGVLEEAMQIEAECAERRQGRGGEHAFYTNLAVMHFGRPDEENREAREEQA